MSAQDKGGPEVVVRVPPHNDEAERAVLGCALASNALIGPIAQLVNAQSFYRETHKIIWRAILELHGREVVVDSLTLGDLLIQRGEAKMIEPGGKIHYHLETMGAQIPNLYSAEYYARIVANDAGQRLAIASLTKVVDSLYEDTTQADQLPQLLGKIALDCAPPSAQRLVKGGEDLVSSWDAYLDAAIEPGGGGASTGIAGLDRMLDGGLYSGRSYYCGGLSKMGKTTLAVALAAHMAMRNGWAVEFLSCEMGPEEVFSRLVSWDSSVDLKRYQAARRLERDTSARREADAFQLGDLDRLPAWREAVAASRERYRTSLVRITSQGLPVARDYEAQVKARQLQLEVQGHDPSKLLAVADYLQAFRTGNSKVDSDDFSRVAGVSQRLNAISKDCKIPIWIPFQFGREAEKNFLQLGKVPTFADARGASQIANDANHLLVYHRPWWREIGERASYVRLVSELSRTGSDHRVAHLEVDMGRQRFTSWEQDAPTEDELENAAREAANLTQKHRSRRP